MAILWGLHSLLQQYFGVTAGAAHDPQHLQALRAEVETKTQQAAQIDALLAESRELDRTYDALLDENPNLRAAARQRKQPHQ
ncbi:MAG: hypothetical protein Q8P67_17370 [archaeon]|nr:hypothetical protein [archaeon]